MGIEIKITAVDADELRVHLLSLGQMAMGGPVEYLDVAGEPEAPPVPEAAEPKKRGRKKAEPEVVGDPVPDVSAAPEVSTVAETVSQAETEEKLEDLQQKARVLCAELTGTMGIPSGKIVEALKETGGDKIGLLSATQCRDFIQRLEKIKASAA